MKRFSDLFVLATVRERFCSHKLLAQTALHCKRSCDLTALWALKNNAVSVSVPQLCFVHSYMNVEIL